MGNVLILGSFDGVHLGHRALFEKAKAVTQSGKKPIALLFDKHPSEILGKRVDLLNTLDEKERLIRLCGIDREYINFDKSVASMEPQQYVDFLCRRFSPDAFVIGLNHTFGKNASGSAVDLIRYSHEYQYKVHIQPSVMYNDEAISSTRIRKCISERDIDNANVMLGGYYSFAGEVQHGRSVGTSMGVPTANIKYPPKKIELPNGVYCVIVHIDGNKYASVMNVGFKPTFGNGLDKTVECFILGGYNGDLYGRSLRVDVVKYIRDERRFETTEALKKQIFDDVAITVAYIKTHFRDILY